MEIDYIRDYAMYAAIFGSFAFAWFGWAQENPPARLRPYLAAGSVVGAAIALSGGLLAASHWDSATTLMSDDMYLAFGMIVLAEIVACLIGSLLLIRLGYRKLIASWIAFVVGAHFVPSAIMFIDPWLYLLSVLIAGIAAISPFTEKIRVPLHSNTFVCVATGIVLLSFAIRGLVLFFT